MSAALQFDFWKNRTLDHFVFYSLYIEYIFKNLCPQIVNRPFSSELYWFLVFGLEEEINSFISLFIGIGSTFTTLIVPLDALDGWFVLPKSAICFRGTNLEFVGAPSKTCQNFKRCKVLMKVRHNFKLLHGYLAMGLSGSWKFCIVLQSYNL